MIVEKIEIFAPDENDTPTRYVYLADRVDYLEAVCVGVNAALGTDG